MNEMTMFDFNGKEVRTTVIDGEPWAALKDVCAILGIKDHYQVFERLDDDERGRYQIPTNGGVQEMLVVSEAGIYDIIARSDKPEARKFRRWVTHEVLPAIRRQGYYSNIPPEQLAPIVLAACNDEWKLQNVIIPALRDANVDQSRLVAKYMGLTAEEYGRNTRLLKKSDENQRAKRTLHDWERRGQRIYTCDDVPEKWREKLTFQLAADSCSKSAANYGRFAKYCGTLYFDRWGYRSIIEHMLKKGHITEAEALEWIQAERLM